MSRGFESHRFLQYTVMSFIDCGSVVRGQMPQAQWQVIRAMSGQVESLPFGSHGIFWKVGRVWFNAPVLKTGGSNGSMGSNPIPSSKLVDLSKSSC